MPRAPVAAPPPAIGNSRSSSPRPAPEPRRQRSRSSASHFTGERSVAELRRRAEFLAGKGLTYKFGGDHPSEGGMDCSGTMQFLLKSMGYSDIPRTSYAQYQWLKGKGTLKNVGFFHRADRAVKKFQPGDLIFWGGTYDSGHKVSHVMIYLGQSRTGKQYVFGARGKKVKGLNGAGVDVFEFNPRSTGGRLVGYGRLPGLKS